MSATHRNWDDWSFWAAVRPVLDEEARQSGGHDGLEALSAIWEVLKKRFPNGEVHGPNPSAFISKTIRLETRKYFQKRENRLLPSADFDLSHLQDNDLDASALADRPGFLGTISLDQLLAILSPAERDLLCRKFGINRDLDSTQSLAKELGITRQGVRKRLVRILVRLRDQACRFHIDEQEAS